jgi:hypothetical protein
MPTEEGRWPGTPLGRKRGHCTAKTGEMAYLLFLITWAGGTVRQLYHNTETVMNEEEKSYFSEKIQDQGEGILRRETRSVSTGTPLATFT